jgi:hypothetical protein
MNDNGVPKNRKLRRKGEVVLGKQKWIILPGSVRSTVQEIERLRADELARTGIEWEVCDA